MIESTDTQSVAILENKSMWGVAAKVNERYCIDGNATWAKQRKALGITSSTPKADVKRQQNEFMALKKDARKQARAVGAQLVSGENFGLKVQTWMDKKGVKRFSVAGVELVDEENEAKESARLKAELEAKDKAIAAAKVAQRAAMLAAGLTAEQVDAILA